MKKIFGAGMAALFLWMSFGFISSSAQETEKANVAPKRGKFKVAPIRIHPATGNMEENFRRSEEMIRKAAAMGAKVMLLPEQSLSGFVASAETTRAIAEPVPGPFTERFGALAKELGVAVIFGIPEKRGDKFYNTSVLVDSEGKFVGKYSKVHEWYLGAFSRGDELPVFDLAVDGIRCKVGIIICYDIEFPEAARVLRLQGAEILFHPSASPAKDKRPAAPTEASVEARKESEEPPVHHRACAYHNQVYLVEVNFSGMLESQISGKAGESLKDRFWAGASDAIDPRGEVVATAKDQEETLIAEVDLDFLDRVRRERESDNLDKYRRPDLYQILVAPLKSQEGTRP